jgi:hypothetical protein
MCAQRYADGCSSDALRRQGNLLSSQSVDLTSNGNRVLDFEVSITSNGTTQATAVSGLGDKAVYLNNPGLDQILNVQEGERRRQLGRL